MERVPARNLPGLSALASERISIIPPAYGQIEGHNRLQSSYDRSLIFFTIHAATSYNGWPAHNQAARRLPRAIRYFSLLQRTQDSIANQSGHLAAFEDFLTSFKSSETSATTALENLNIEEDGLSEEYDFLEDADELNGAAAPNRSRRRQRDPKQKYMEILQSVADRHTSEVCIELDDLDLYEKSLGDEIDLKLVESIERNARRYIDILSEAVDKVMPKETREIS